MITHDSPGIVTVPGRLFRQRWLSMHTDDPARPTQRWILSVLDTYHGPMVELHSFHPRQTIVGTNVAQHSLLVPAMEAARNLLEDPDGWTAHAVLACTVEGCRVGLPLYSDRPGECPVHAAESVLACDECGAPDFGTWANRRQLLAANLCFNCNHWRQVAADFDPAHQFVTDDHLFYSAASFGFTGGRAAHKGFGGRRWTIRWRDGREAETDNLWCGGEIPAWFRDRLAPTAELAPYRMEAPDAE